MVDVSDLPHPKEVAFFHLDGAGTHNFWMDESRQILYMAYYNFCWMHATLGKTPAMAAKVASHPWSIEELYERVMATVEE